MRQVRFFDDGLFPYLLDQFLFADDGAAIRNEDGERLDDLRWQRDGLVTAVKHERVGVETEFVKYVNPLFGTVSHRELKMKKI